MRLVLCIALCATWVDAPLSSALICGMSDMAMQATDIRSPHFGYGRSGLGWWVSGRADSGVVADLSLHQLGSVEIESDSSGPI